MIWVVILLLVNQPESSYSPAVLSIIEKYGLYQDTSTECLDGTCTILTNGVNNYPSWAGLCLDNHITIMARVLCERNELCTVAVLKPMKMKVLCVRNSNCADLSPCTREELLSFVDDINSFCPNTTTKPPTTTTANIEPPTTTTEPSTTEPSWVCDVGACSDGECYYMGHCYSLHLYTSVFDPMGASSWADGVCTDGFPVAVETKQEDAFLKSILSHFIATKNEIFLTSGVKDAADDDGRWVHWNESVDLNVLELDHPVQNSIFVIAPSEQTDNLIWKYVSLTDVFPSININNNTLIVCEKSLNWKQCLPDTKCEDNTAMCCASDEYGDLWMACDGSVSNQGCARWKCGPDGFETEYPDRSNCNCEEYCEKIDEYGVIFKACNGSWAYGTCQAGDGQLKWYCQGTEFVGDVPDRSTCCDQPCRKTDPFDMLWVGCPGEVRRTTLCPNQNNYKEVSWYCQSGKFEGETPDYSNCSCDSLCEAVDEEGDSWSVCGGSLGVRTCPVGTHGMAYWYCHEDGRFDGHGPDFSECRDWIDNVLDEIASNSNAQVIMDTIRSNTEDNTTDRLDRVTNATLGCVNLFRDQCVNASYNCNEGNFTNFTQSFADVLVNIASSEEDWAEEKDSVECTLNILKASDILSKTLAQIPLWTKHFYYKTFNEDQGVPLAILYTRNKTQVGVFLNKTQCNCSVALDMDNFANGSTYILNTLVINQPVAQFMFPPPENTSILNAPLLSITLSQYDEHNSDPVDKSTHISLMLKHHIHVREPTTTVIRRRLHRNEHPSAVLSTAKCVYWDLENNIWSEEGCSVRWYNKQEIACSCQHMSSFSALMDIHKYEPDAALEAVSITCSSISCVSLVMTIAVLLRIKSLQSERTSIEIHLCVCLLIGHIMVLTVMDKTYFNISDWGCTIVAFFIHFIFSAAFCWMSLEAHHLYRLVVQVFNTGANFRIKYIIAGYGFPITIVSITWAVGGAVEQIPYGRDEICWLTSPYFVWAFMGPVIFLTVVNLIILIIAMRAAIVAKAGEKKSMLTNLRVWLKGCFSLSTLLGVTWLFGLTYIDYSPVCVYIFVILNGLQGLFIFLFRCIFNEQVRSWVLRSLSNSAASDAYNKSIKKPKRDGSLDSGRGDSINEQNNIRQQRRDSGTDSLQSLDGNDIILRVPQVPVWEEDSDGNLVFKATIERSEKPGSNYLSMGDLLKKLHSDRQKVKNSQFFYQGSKNLPLGKKKTKFRETLSSSLAYEEKSDSVRNRKY